MPKPKEKPKEKPLDLKKIVAAFRVVWEERGRKWPVEVPSTHNVRYEAWITAFVWDIHGFVPSWSLQQLTRFIFNSTGVKPTEFSFSVLCNQARKLIDAALTIDPTKDDDLFRVKDAKLVSSLWSVNITEEAMGKKTIAGKSKPVEVKGGEIAKSAAKEAARPEAIAEPAKPTSATANKFEPSEKLAGVSVVASLLLFQLAEALDEDYSGKEVKEMVARLRALSDAFAEWGGVA